MNKEEFDNNQLEEILKELKDVENYKGFKDGAWKYELGYYQGLLIVDKINQLKEKIDEAIEYIENTPITSVGLLSCGETSKHHCLGEDMVDDLLEILKGDSNE